MGIEFARDRLPIMRNSIETMSKPTAAFFEAICRFLCANLCLNADDDKFLSIVSIYGGRMFRISVLLPILFMAGFSNCKTAPVGTRVSVSSYQDPVSPLPPNSALCFAPVDIAVPNADIAVRSRYVQFLSACLSAAQKATRKNPSLRITNYDEKCLPILLSWEIKSEVVDAGNSTFCSPLFGSMVCSTSNDKRLQKSFMMSVSVGQKKSPETSNALRLLYRADSSINNDFVKADKVTIEDACLAIFSDWGAQRDNEIYRIQ